MSFMLGGVAVPLSAALDLSQTYEPIGAVTTLRAMNGAALRMTHWRRLRTSVSGSGWVPAGLQALDYGAQLELRCIAPRALIADGARQATLPAARRSDTGYAPWAVAVLADGSVTNTPVVLAGNVATADAVAGATGYRIHYYPVLTVYAEPPTERFDPQTGAAGWEITAEEI